MDTPKYTGLVPMLPVTSVARAIEFYESIGFKVGHTVSDDDDSEPNWAWMYNGDAHVMLSLSSATVVVSHQSASCWVYTKDVPAAYEYLKSKGHDVGEISYPFYNPRGEFHVHDPDGYAIFIAHAD